MKRSWTPALAASALIFSWASSAFAEPAAARRTFTGTFIVVGTVTMGKNIPKGAKVSLSAGASGSGQSVFSNSHSVSLSVQVKNSSGKATVTLTMPYTWTIVGTPTLVTVFFSASSFGLPANPSSSITVGIPLPPNGAKKVVNLPAAI